MEDSDCILGKKIQRPRSRNSEVNGTQMLSSSSLARERERDSEAGKRKTGWVSKAWRSSMAYQYMC